MRVNTNIHSLLSYNALTSTWNDMENVVRNLSTGLRINSAADDPTGLAIAENMETQIRGMSAASDNAHAGRSMLRTAESGLENIASILLRMRELALVSANDAMTDEDRIFAQNEIDLLKDEITRIANTTQFNGRSLLDGSAAALWSSSHLSTKAIINGDIWKIDPLGLTSSGAGNFNIRISTLTPGRGEAKISGIFRVRGSDVLSHVTLVKDRGFDGVWMGNAPAGEYEISVGNVLPSTPPRFEPSDKLTSNTNAGITPSGGDLNTSTPNASILLEVLEIGGSEVKFRATVAGTYADGTPIMFSEDVYINDTGFFGLSATSDFYTIINDPAAIKLSSSTLTDYTVGDKFVLGVVAGDIGAAEIELKLSSVDQDWGGVWNDVSTPAHYAFGPSAVRNSSVYLHNFYINQDTGEVHQSYAQVSLNGQFTAQSSLLPGASFGVTFDGKVADGTIKLSDIDKFYDVNGNSLLGTPQTLSILQADGRKASLTLYSTDTLDSLARKLNDAVAFDLGQGRYAKSSASINDFVTFVDKGLFGTLEPSSGALVIRSIVPGEGGRLTLSGPRDLINALSLSQLQKPEESVFMVSVYDAHTGRPVTRDVVISGDVLYGVVNDNVDVKFNPMASIAVGWDAASRGFSWTSGTDPYETTLHLTSSRTVFQTGPNEGESVGLGIGDMSAEALGVSDIFVTDRNSASRAVTRISGAMNKVSRQQAMLGAQQNSLGRAIDYLTTASANVTEAESHIRDADMAKEAMAYAKLKIMSQVGSAIFAQANQLPQNVFSLLL
ncbi:MAG: flagellin [Synergistaceae bacterium]|nr:flagellin [Synergistaceae bacterium]